MTKGMKNWDMCAPEALLRAQMGVVTDKDLNQIEYDAKLDQLDPDYSLMNGVIIAKNQSMHNLIYNRMKPFFTDLKIRSGTELR